MDTMSAPPPRISARGATALPVETIANVCAALADPTRLRILALLVHGEVCVCNIHGSLDVPQPTASRHLAYLRRHGLVATRRDGLWVHYRLAEDLPAGVRHAIDGVLHCVTHSPEARTDGRHFAQTTGRRVPLRPVPTRGCCAPHAED
jgi:ArsR family transcriptional regulator